MKQKNGFIKGALCGALTVLLVMGVISCGIREVKSDDAGQSVESTENTETKLNFLKALI